MWLPGTGGVRSQTPWRSQVMIPPFLQALKQVAASFQLVTSVCDRLVWQQHPPAAGGLRVQLGHAKDRHCHKSDVSDMANTFNLYQ